MPLRVRMELAVLAALVVYLGFAYGITRLLILPSFSDLERSEAKEDLDRCIGALQHEIQNISTLAHDWGSWDDTYIFAMDRNEAFIESNLVDESFIDNRLNVIYIINREGGVLWGRVRGLDGRDLALTAFPNDEWPKDQPLLNAAFSGRNAAGYMVTERGAVLVASRPILTSQNQGPPRGALIMGRFMDDNLLKLLSDQVRVRFVMRSLVGPSVPKDVKNLAARVGQNPPVYMREENDDLISAHTTLPELRGVPAILLSTYTQRDITMEGRTAAGYALVAIMGAGILMLLALVFQLRRSVLIPLNRLTRHTEVIRSSGDLTLRLDLGRKDEIGALSVAFDQMVADLEDARKRLVDQSYQTGQAEALAGIMHNIRNTLHPLTGAADMLCGELDAALWEDVMAACTECEQPETSPGRREDLIQFLIAACRSMIAQRGHIRRQLADIQARTSHVEEILRQRESMPQTAPPLERVRPGNIIEDAIALIPSHFRQGIHCETVVAPEATGPCDLFRIAVLHVLVNLLTNAAEAIQRAKQSDGRILIETSLEKIDDSAQLHIQVSDNGGGIDPSILPHIFERGVSSKPAGITGVGLHWCANTLHAQGGSIRAENLANGACFHVYFPIAPATKAAPLT